MAVFSLSYFHMNFKLFFFFFCFVSSISVCFSIPWHWNFGGDYIDLGDLLLVKWPFFKIILQY